MADQLLKIRGLNVSFDTFDGEARVLRDINLDLGREESLGLVGESGCGKSVLALSIMRLIPVPGRIVSGEIWFRDQDLPRLSDREIEKLRGSSLAMILQSPMTSLNPVFKIKTQMVEVLRQHSDMSRQEAIARAAELLEVVGIGEPESVLNTYPYALSGGMSQRVMIAMAVSSNPAVLIADEPTTALDVTIERQIMDLVREVRDQFKTSLIWISHDLGVVRQVCERVAVMYAGTVVETGMAESLLQEALHPYTQALIEAIPSGRNRGRPLPEIKGMVPGLLSIPEGCIFAPRCSEAEEVCRTGAPPPLVEVQPGRQVACRMRGGCAS